MKRWAIAVLLLALVSATAYYVVRRYRPPGAVSVLESQAMDMGAMKPPAGVMPISSEKARQEPFAAAVTYPGTVVAQNDEEVTARVTGQVVEVAVYPGQRVLPGQLLVRLDSAELASRAAEARAGVNESQRQIEVQEAEWHSRQREQAVAASAVPIATTELSEARQMTRATEARLEAARAEFKRTTVLHGEGGASLQELQQGRAELAEAQAQYNTSLLRQQKAALGVRQARAEWQARRGQTEASHQSWQAAQASEQLRQAQLTTAEVQLGYTRILASAPAEVVERVVSPGSLVMPGQVLLRLKQTEKLRLQAYLPAPFAVGIRAGLPVRVHYADRHLEAKVSSVFRAADPTTKTMVVEALLTGQADLVPGAAVTLEIALEPARPRVSVALSALQRDAEGQTFVWLVEQAEAAGPVRYTCVMHPEIVRPAPGKCPKCGMDLVPQKRTGATRVSRQKVRAGPVNRQRVAILEGLDAGQEVVVEGYQDLEEGMAVARVRWGQDGPAQLPTPQAPAEHSGHGGHR